MRNVPEKRTIRPGFFLTKGTILIFCCLKFPFNKFRVCVYVFVCMRVCVFWCVRVSVRGCVFVCLDPRFCISKVHEPAWECVCTYVCMYLYVRVCMCVCVSIRVYYVCMYLYVRVCMCVCVGIRVYDCGNQCVYDECVYVRMSMNVRERVLLIGTQFSILYTFMYSPA